MTAFPRTRTLLLMSVIALVPPRDMEARSRPTGLGSGLAPAFSLQHDVLRPGEDVTLLACVTSQNPAGTRSLEPGVTFRFEFMDGVVADCGDVTAFPLSASPSSAEFTCDSDASHVALTYTGPAIPWPVGHGVCAEVTYTVGDQSSVVLTSQQNGNRGAWIGAEPPAILLSVAPALVAGGAPGPPGPEGPSGPPGASSVGSRLFRVSTDGLSVIRCEPPLAVYGLEGTIDVAAGSNVRVTVDALGYSTGCGILVGDEIDDTLMHVEFDGTIVASRYVDIAQSTRDDELAPTLIDWLSSPLPAGVHGIRVLLENPRCIPSPSTYRTRCVGSSLNDGYQARLTAVELRN